MNHLILRVRRSPEEQSMDFFSGPRVLALPGKGYAHVAFLRSALTVHASHPVVVKRAQSVSGGSAGVLSDTSVSSE